MRKQDRRDNLGKILSQLIGIHEDLKEIKEKLQIIEDNLKPDSEIDGKAIYQAVQKSIHDNA